MPPRSSSVSVVDLAHDDDGLGYQGIQVNIGWSKSEDHHKDRRGRVLDLNYT